jgi:hypothetical protein
METKTLRGKITWVSTLHHVRLLLGNGSKPTLRTMQSNKDTYMKDILFNKLSKTYQDAIVITQKLGIRYI